jgi:hypothetical protein
VATIYRLVSQRGLLTSTWENDSINSVALVIAQQDESGILPSGALLSSHNDARVNETPGISIAQNRIPGRASVNYTRQSLKARSFDLDSSSLRYLGL